MAGTASAQTDPARAPLDEATARITSGRVLSAAAWAGVPNVNDLIAAVVEREDRNSRNPPHHFIVVFRRSSATPPDVERGIELDPNFQTTGMSVIDIGDDAKPELLVFGRAPSAETSSVAVVEYDAPSGTARQLLAQSAALDGCANESDVRARLPLSNGLSPEQIGSLTERSIVGRIRFSSPAQIRALIARSGLQICNVQAPSGGRRTQACRRYAQSRLTDAIIRRDVLPRLGSLLGENVGWGAFRCSTGTNAQCENDPYQGYSYRVEFTGTGPSRRVARMTETDQMLGE